jgi:hypothetical protein
MAVLARSDNNLMVKMTKRSMADARTLKTITILTLVYLPASFVSVSNIQRCNYDCTEYMLIIADIFGHVLCQHRAYESCDNQV